MPSIPSNISRVPDLLGSQLSLINISRSNVSLLNLSNQISSGHTINTYSDDPIAAAAIAVLKDKAATGKQVTQNLANADNSLSYLDSSLGDAADVIRQAGSLASSQIGTGSDAATRTNQAAVVDGYLSQLFGIANRSTNGLYVFGGSTPTQPPLQSLHGGYRYVGTGAGLNAQLGAASDVPITIGGSAIGATSTRVQGTVDLNPALTSATRLADINGARGLGISNGKVTVSFNGGPTATIDLSKADTIGDVATALQSGLQQYETDNGVTILGPGGVSVSGGALHIDVVTGTPSNPALTFGEANGGITGTDLGLTQSAFTATTASGADTNPKITALTPLSSLSGLTVPAGTVRFRFSGSDGSTSFTDVDLSGAQTVGDLQSAIQTQVPGVRVEVNDAGSGLNVVNEIAGPALSIEPTGTGPNTASELGIRTLDTTTKVSDYNDGRGVRIVDNVTDPATGTATRAANTDFRITLGNGQAFDVDLRPQDIVDTQSVLDRINSEYTAAVAAPPINASAPALVAGQFTAGLSTTGNGIALKQTGITGAISVLQQNNSAAAQDLGLEGGTYDPASATFVAQDPSGVYVNNIFTALVQLRDSLRGNDSNGITLAGGTLDNASEALTQSQALVGVYSNRVTQAQSTQADENTLTESTRSQLQDVDIASAAVQLSQLQNQLEASYRVVSLSQSQSLLNFLPIA